MTDTDETLHRALYEEIEAETVAAGERSVVYAEDDLPTLANEQDGRSKTVLINHDLLPRAGGLLVDIVTYGPGVAVAEHVHDGTDHSFYVLEGSGVIEIEGETFDLESGSVAWVGEGDRHRLYAGEDEGMRVLEYFSNNDHEVTFFGERHAWTADD
jgi:quercetin dioxygenase-like cupin family protein